MPSRRVERVAESLVIQKLSRPRMDAEGAVYIRVLHKADGDGHVWREYERIAEEREAGLRGLGIDPRWFGR